MCTIELNPRYHHMKYIEYCMYMYYVMEGEDGALNLTATGPLTAEINFNSTCINT